MFLSSIAAIWIVAHDCVAAAVWYGWQWPTDACADADDPAVSALTGTVMSVMTAMTAMMAMTVMTAMMAMTAMTAIQVDMALWPDGLSTMATNERAEMSTYSPIAH